jgi:hypothetical protein
MLARVKSLLGIGVEPTRRVISIGLNLPFPDASGVSEAIANMEYGARPVSAAT